MKRSAGADYFKVFWAKLSLVVHCAASLEPVYRFAKSSDQRERVRGSNCYLIKAVSRKTKLLKPVFRAVEGQVEAEELLFEVVLCQRATLGVLEGEVDGGLVVLTDEEAGSGGNAPLVKG